MTDCEKIIQASLDTGQAQLDAFIQSVEDNVDLALENHTEFKTFHHLCVEPLVVKRAHERWSSADLDPLILSLHRRGFRDCTGSAHHYKSGVSFTVKMFGG